MKLLSETSQYVRVYELIGNNHDKEVAELKAGAEDGWERKLDLDGYTKDGIRIKVTDSKEIAV